jgi:hypothetical protein
MLTRLAPVMLLLVALGGATPAQAQTPALDPRIQKLLSEVSQERLRALVEKLQGFGTRNTLSSADSPTTGIGAARQWIHDEMQRSSARLQVSFDTYQVAAQGRIARDIELRNVMAILPGRSARRVYVSGHYDSLNLNRNAPRPSGEGQNPADVVAPGANDDGSGTALTMELARVFGESGLDFDATLVFIAFAGEEQGLIGATAHAQRAEAEKIPIEAVFNNDMVGNVAGGGGLVDGESVRVFAEGPEDSPSRQLARFIWRVAGLYEPSLEVRLIARHDRFGRGGDHTAFNQHGFAAVRVTEANENYARQHSAEDTVEGISFAYLAGNARMNAAAVATMALAPPPPRVVDARGRPMLGRQPSGYDAHLRWEASPGAVGYRVVWREAWTPDWQHEVAVGDVTELVLQDVSIDDYVFGVAAVGPGGHESPVSAYVNPPRAGNVVKVK